MNCKFSYLSTEVTCRFPARKKGDVLNFLTYTARGKLNPYCPAFFRFAPILDYLPLLLNLRDKVRWGRLREKGKSRSLKLPNINMHIPIDCQRTP
jgi:hypothetical protein